MESAEKVKISDREKALADWLTSDCKLFPITLSPMLGDASFRRYYRMRTAAQSFVVMDAPPAKEDCRPFVAVANALRHIGLSTPEIIHANFAQGFLVITDFGDDTYLKMLNKQNADELYHAALNVLVILQGCRHVAKHDIPIFSSEWMWQEWAWHKEWFLNKLLNIVTIENEKTLDANFGLLVESAKNQPQVFMHRDYHSANLMVLPQAVGILDFQDAFWGPITYDLVSLLRDCYIDWPEDRIKYWVLFYLRILQQQGELQQVKQETFIQWFDWMGVERHLKALFTFARKQVRDRQSHYLQHIPRTLNYILRVTRHYPELQFLYHYYEETVLPVFMKVRKNLCVL